MLVTINWKVFLVFSLFGKKKANEIKDQAVVEALILRCRVWSLLAEEHAGIMVTSASVAYLLGKKYKYI